MLESQYVHFYVFKIKHTLGKYTQVYSLQKSKFNFQIVWINLFLKLYYLQTCQTILQLLCAEHIHVQTNTRPIESCKGRI